MSIWQGWEQQLLAAIGAPTTQQNISFLDKWASIESGAKGTGGGQFNPLNTTQTEPGSTAFNFNNGFPVQNFPNASEGITATATTLQNGYYPDILSALQSGNPFANITQAMRSQLNTWGTGSSWLSGSSGGGLSDTINQTFGNLHLPNPLDPNNYPNPIGGITNAASGIGSAWNTFMQSQQAKTWWLIPVAIVVVLIGLVLIIQDNEGTITQVTATAGKVAAS